MQIDASNSVTINDIVIGDVWLCSGQSDMALSLGILWDIYKDEIENLNNKFIRHFIIVWSNKVAEPVAVRYAWSNNPEGANLYNKEGLPASPFRTSEIY